MRIGFASLAAVVLLAAPAFADGGPVSEAPPPPPPAEEAPPPPPPAAAPASESRFYVEGAIGAAFADDLGYGCCELEIEKGPSGGGAFGMNVFPGVAVEVDVFYADMGYGGCATICVDPDFTSRISGLSVMLDAIYTFETGGIVDPYIGGGAGGIRVRYDGKSQFPAFTGTDWRFGYQAMGGLMFRLEEKINLFAEYRFHDAIGDAEIKGVSGIEYRSHNVSGGFRINF